MKKTYEEEQEEAIKELIKIDHPLLKEDMNIRDVVISLATTLAYNKVESEEKIIRKFWEETHEGDEEKINILVKETIDYLENIEEWIKPVILEGAILILCPNCQALFVYMMDTFVESRNWTCPECKRVFPWTRFLEEACY